MVQGLQFRFRDQDLGFLVWGPKASCRYVVNTWGPKGLAHNYFRA